MQSSITQSPGRHEQEFLLGSNLDMGILSDSAILTLKDVDPSSLLSTSFNHISGKQSHVQPQQAEDTIYNPFQ